MKNWILYIWMIGLAGVFASCSSRLDDEMIQDQDKVGITFALSMNNVGTVSRSLSSEMATQYENTIDPDNFCVLAYTADGEVHEVTIFIMRKISNDIYEISGELKGNHSVTKVMILANCGKSFDPSNPSFNTLAYDYSGSDFNPENPKKYIPMWGVKEIKTPLEPGTSNNIGTINLLRAMAKIQVSLSESSIGCELIQVKMNQYNSKGACLPHNFDRMTETVQVTEATIPDGVTMGSNLPFYQVDNKSYVLYIPEFKGIDIQNAASIFVKVRDVNGEFHTKNIIFGKYNTLGAFAGEYWDIVRNHYYAFNLRLEVALDGDLTLEAKTEKYAEFELEPVYGD